MREPYCLRCQRCPSSSPCGFESVGILSPKVAAKTQRVPADPPAPLRSADILWISDVVFIRRDFVGSKRELSPNRAATILSGSFSPQQNFKRLAGSNSVALTARPTHTNQRRRSKIRWPYLDLHGHRESDVHRRAASPTQVLSISFLP